MISDWFSVLADKLRNLHWDGKNCIRTSLDEKIVSALPHSFFQVKCYLQKAKFHLNLRHTWDFESCSVTVWMSGAMEGPCCPVSVNPKLG